jgi:hypothetical protein
MSASVEFLLRLFEQGRPPQVAHEDFEGAHRGFLRACQEAGFLSREPGAHPVPSCPHCGEGVPYRLGRRHLCNCCGSTVDPRRLRSWRLDLAAFLRWLAAQLHLRGDVRRIDDRLWQLGTHEDSDGFCECFYSQGGPLLEAARSKLMAFRNAVVLYGLSRPRDAEALPVTLVSLLGILGVGESLAIAARTRILRGGGEVRFDPLRGRLDVAGVWQGDVPVGSREHAFLACVARRQGQYVAYIDIKREVLRCSGGGDSRDEASFCHRLKSRIKKKYIPHIDSLLSTSNRADGYMLLTRREP